MANENTGSIYVEIRAALDKLQSDVDKAQSLFKNVADGADVIPSKFDDVTKKVGKGLNDLSKGAVNKIASMMNGMQKAILAVPIVGLLLGIAAAVKKAFSAVSSWINETADAYRQYRAEIAKTNVLLQQTGATAWTNSQRLVQQARDLADATTFAEEEILRLQGSLLRFTSITGENFNRTTRLALNMATVLGKDAAGAANNLGRALEDPVFGMRQLRREGVMFTEEQQKLIKHLVDTGRQLEAQNKMLEILEGTYSGTAEAVGSVFDAQSRLQNSTERLRRAQGEATSGINVWWTNVRAGWTESRLKHQELRNEIERGFRFDSEKHARTLEDMRIQLRLTTDSVERLRLERKIELKELEAQITRQKQILSTHEKTLHIYTETFSGMFKKLGDHIHDALSWFSSGRWADTAARNIERATRQVQYHRKALESLEAQQEELLNTGAIDVANKAIYRQQTELIDQQVGALGALADVQRNRYNRIREIQRAEAAGLIDFEQAQQSRQAAYVAEANAINTIISALQNLTLSDEGAIARRASEITRLDGLLREATINSQRYAEAVSDGFEPISVEEIDEFIETVTRNLQFARIAIQDEYDRGKINAEEFTAAILETEQHATQSTRPKFEF